MILQSLAFILVRERFPQRCSFKNLFLFYSVTRTDYLNTFEFLDAVAEDLQKRLQS